MLILFVSVSSHYRLRSPLTVWGIFAMFGSIAATPNCDNRTEVEEFLRSDPFLATFSYYSNVSNSNVTSYVDEFHDDQLEFAFTSNQILPANKSLYLKHRPPKLCGNPIQANFHITILALDTINESAMTFTLDAWLTVGWFDERLRYPDNISTYHFLDPAWVPRLWIPDVVFTNARKVQFHNLMVPNHFHVFMQNKALLYMLKLTLELTCPMNLKLYPHDSQVCDMMMESMKYTTRDITFAWDSQHPVTFSTEDGKIETPQFTAVRNDTISNCTTSYTSGMFPCIRIRFYLKRRIGYHIIRSFLPSTLVVVLSWVSFWMKPEEIAARFGVGLTSFLTLATLNNQSQEELPPVSYSKAIDTWMITCSLFVFASIVEFAVVNYLVWRFPVQEIVLPKISPTTGMLNQMRAQWNNRKVQILAHNIDRACRVFFPASFIMFNIYYWKVH